MTIPESFDENRQYRGSGSTGRFSLPIMTFPAVSGFAAWSFPAVYYPPDVHGAGIQVVYCSRALKEMDSSIRLAVCPTQYYGNGDEPYITVLGLLLDPMIDIFWTGPEICSPRLTLADAGFLSRRINRPILYWDNYPVNDLRMAGELHIGPYRGRDPHLYRSSIGIVANGMEYPESSKIGLLTIADYLWNPEAYNPEVSWEKALQTVIGPAQWKDFRFFADNNRFSSLYPADSPDLKTSLESVNFFLFRNKKKDALSVLGATLLTAGQIAINLEKWH